MKRHKLELKEPYFTDMAEGRKSFEVRQERPGRRFEPGDVLVFKHSDDPKRTFQRRVTYVLRDMSWYGIPDDIAVLALDPIDTRDAYREMVRIGQLADRGGWPAV